MNKLINELAAEVPNRRRFLSKMAVASAAVGAIGTQKLGAQSSMITDVDILNFALIWNTWKQSFTLLPQPEKQLIS